MTDEFSLLFSKYRQKGILIDTNILLLYFVGTLNKERISKFNRTQNFTPEDYDLLVRIIASFSKRFVTPNILTEVNSLSNKLGEPERSRCFAIFSSSMPLFEEVYINSETTSKNEGFTKFGLTDCAIAELAKDKYLVLTDDFKLAIFLQNKGIDIINFNHLRVYSWS